MKTNRTLSAHFLMFTAAFLFLMLLLPALGLFGGDLLAQPGLPSAPTQAPIDGGLALLAAAGGAYAWKKLKKSDQ